MLLSSNVLKVNYSGTCPKSVFALNFIATCLHRLECFTVWKNCLREKWNAKSIYVVGKATAGLGKTDFSNN